MVFYYHCYCFVQKKWLRYVLVVGVAEHIIPPLTVIVASWSILRRWYLGYHGIHSYVALTTSTRKLQNKSSTYSYDMLRKFHTSRLGWHLPGLSEFPPEHRLLLRVLLAGPFQLFFAIYITFFLYTSVFTPPPPPSFFSFFPAVPSFLCYLLQIWFVGARFSSSEYFFWTFFSLYFDFWFRV